MCVGFFPALTGAQDVDIPRPRPLEKIKRNLLPGEYQCGPFIQLTSWGNAFQYTADDGKSKGSSVTARDVRVKISPSANPPVVVQDKNERTTTFTLTQEEYDKATGQTTNCLPAPSKD
jgi:hypothetical protein